MTHIFFASYARLDDTDEKLRRAVDLLRERVRAKMALKEKDLEKIGFFDTTELTTGTEWQKKLGKALSNIRLLVCMCSPLYISSEYCAKEFAVFQKRLDEAGADMNGKVTIVPVIWEPGAPPMELPDVIAKYQAKDDRFPKAYGVDGLSQLIRFPSQRGKYLKTIEILAEIIGKAHAASTLPVFKTPVEFEQLPKFFHNPKPGPYNATLTVLHKNGTQWKPDEARPNIGALFDAVTKSLDKMAWQEIQPEATTIAANLARAMTERQVSIVVVTRESAAKAPWKQLLAEIDKAARPNCAVLLGWTDDDAAAPVAQTNVLADLQKMLPNSSAGKSFHDVFPLQNVDVLKDALTKAITGVRLALINADPTLKARSEELRGGAISTGIQVDTLTTLTGPTESGTST